MRNDFACLILSHGRANNVKTVKTLEKSGYTGKWYIIVDDEDDQYDEYIKNYGEEHIIKFQKYKKSLECETCDLPRKRNAVLYARNVCFQVARWLKIDYFLELDDDYDAFSMRYDDNGKFATIYVRKMDLIVDEMLKFLDLTGAYTVAFAQAGDFIGGMGSKVYKDRLTRKAMNAFFARLIENSVL